MKRTSEHLVEGKIDSEGILPDIWFLHIRDLAILVGQFGKLYGFLSTFLLFSF